MTTKESKELIVALVRLGKLVAKHVQDGIGLDDAVILYDLVNDPVYKEALVGINEVIPEIKSMNVVDAVELMQAILDELK